MISITLVSIPRRSIGRDRVLSIFNSTHTMVCSRLEGTMLLVRRSHWALICTCFVFVSDKNLDLLCNWLFFLSKLPCCFFSSPPLSTSAAGFVVIKTCGKACLLNLAEPQGSIIPQARKKKKKKNVTDVRALM